MEHDLDQRLPHPRGRIDGGAGESRSRSPTRSHTSRPRSAAGLDVNAFGQRVSFFFNAHNDFLEEVAKFRAARRLWARLMRDRFGATQPARAATALPYPDGRQHADRAAARQQHRTGRPPGAVGGPRRDPVAAHQRPRRGAGAADRGVGAHRAAHAADHRARNRRHQHRGSVRRRRTHIEQLTNEIEARRRGAARADRRAWAARWRRSKAAISSARFRTRPTRRSWPSTPATRSSSASTAIRRTRRSASRCSRSIPRSSRRRWRGCGRCARAATDRAGGGRSTRWRRPPDRATTSCLAIVAAVEAHATVGEIADTLREVFGEYNEVALD